MEYLFFSEADRREWGEQFKRLFPDSAQKAKAEADYYCENNAFLWKGQVIEMGTPINWLHNPTGDKEFTWSMNRFKHLRSLGISYACTGDERYAAKALEHIIGWIETQPCPRHLPEAELTYFQRPGPWRLLEVGLRLRQWVYAYHFFHGSESWTTDLEQRFFDSVKEHGWFLSTYMASLEINHSIMHMIGLLSVSLTFESWEESKAWRQKAVERLEQCIRVQVLPDGVHTELTPHYHMVSLELFTDCAYMMSKRGYSFSEEYERILGEMVSFARCMKRPDGGLAPFADSYAGNLLDINATALYCHRPGDLLKSQLHEQFWTFGPEAIVQMLHEAENTPSIEAEAELPFAFPSAGYYGMGNREHKMIFDAAGLGGPHGHADALSFELYAFGEPIFVDTGTYTYMENPWRRYFKSTAAHNTILVDGQDQTPYLRTQRWGEPEAQVSLLAWDPDGQFICAEHDGYKIRGIMHRRAVWFLETGEWILFDRLQRTDNPVTGAHTTGAHTTDDRTTGADTTGAHTTDDRTMGADTTGAHTTDDRTMGAHTTSAHTTDDRTIDARTTGVHTIGAHTYQHRLHSRLLHWQVQDNSEGPFVKFYAEGTGSDNEAIGCELLLFGCQGTELDVEDSWESVESLKLDPLKVVQGLLTTGEKAWFITVLSPYQGQRKLQPEQWSVVLDEADRPVLHVQRAGDSTSYTMPE
ncbi:alginate lyase family protein [Paenibacillus fonticola]|uniref:alginate lyase family protein n=1 Tax=Paenibacillus fonticola TaxID=379896 RepID=UPI0003602D7E|nr:alginate lyase family protein [Paenibacillus fonticola]